MRAWPLAALLAVGAACGAARAQDVAPVASPTDAAGAEPDLFAPADPFATSPGPADPAPGPGPEPARGGPPWFDPDAVRAGARPGVWLGPIELHGRANLTYSYSDGEEPIERLEHSELHLSSLDLYAEWRPWAWLGFIGEVELESELEEDGHEQEVDPELVVVELRPLSDERLRIRAGLFQVPFGLERRYYAPPRNELGTRPAAFRVLFPGSWSDLGVMAWGRQPLGPLGSEVELEVGLIRGFEGPGGRDRRQELEEDDNHEPMVTGRLGATLFDVRPEAGAPLRMALGVGASLLAGHWDDAARRRLRYEGYDATARLGPLVVRFELLLGRIDLDPPGRRRRLAGHYLQAALRHRFALFLLDEGWLAGRWDVIDDDTDARTGGDVERFHLGAGWVPLEGLVVKLEGSRARSLDERVWTVLAEVGYSF